MSGPGTPARWCCAVLLGLCGGLHAQESPSEAWTPIVQAAAAPGDAPGDRSASADLVLTQDAVGPLRAEVIDRGIASWYGARFHGRATASGELFDMHALTAAHPTLPFGTIVRVRSLVNDRVVDVRINDRGPHSGGRVIDLSRAAAAVLGLLQSGAGTKPVQLALLQADRVAPERPRRYVKARRTSGSAAR